MENYENVHVMNHPLIRHKISRLRDETTGTNEFRSLVEEIAMLMGYEALSDLPTKDIEVKTPIDIVNITLHFFLKDVRPMLPLVMKHSTSVA